jgi:hypothetical protein
MAAILKPVEAIKTEDPNQIILGLVIGLKSIKNPILIITIPKIMINDLNLEYISLKYPISGS